MDINVWPKGSNILYLNLSKTGKETVDKHLRLAGNIKIWESLTNWLIDEFHAKKSVFYDKKFNIQDEIAINYYTKYLFKGNDQITSLDVFPCEFMSHLETVLSEELTLNGCSDFNFMDVYYGREDNMPTELRYETYDKTIWSLDNNYSMTVTDIDIMDRYKTELIKFIDDCLRVLSPYKGKCVPSNKYNRMFKERQRIEKVMRIKNNK
jgi:hypothetical protein